MPFAIAIALIGLANQPNNTLVNIEKMQAHMTVLVSDKAEGRLTGSAGERYAGDYIAKQMKDMGLQPGGVNGTYFQEFPTSIGVKASETGNSLKITLPNGKTISATLGKDFNPVVGAKEDTKISGELLFVGEGRTDESRDDYKNLEVSGKIVVLLPAKPGERFNNSARTRIAKEKGAVGVLFFGPIEEKGSFPIMRVTRARGMGRDTGLGGVAISAGFFEKATGLRYATTRKSALEGKLSVIPNGTVAEIQTKTEPNPVTGRNVYGIIPGNDPVLKNQFIVLGAHFDHLGWGDVAAIDGTEKLHRGADDNGSGPSLILEIARYLKNEKTNRRSIMIQFYSGEELGLLGSAAFIKTPTINLDMITAMFNFDMVGNLTNNRIELSGTGTSPTFSELLVYKNGMDIVDVPRLRPDSDQFVFGNKGIPCLFFHTFLHERYHRDTDQMDKINFAGMAQVGALAIDYLTRIDKMDSMLAFKKGDAITERKPPASEGRTGSMGRRVKIGFIPEYSDSGPGVLLSGTSENSPAQKAGLKAGDRVIAWNGKALGSIEDLQEFMLTAVAGKEIELSVQRDGKEIKVKVIPEEPN